MIDGHLTLGHAVRRKLGAWLLVCCALSAAPIAGQDVRMANLRRVTFEELVLDRYQYDGERVALEGYCTKADTVVWTHQREERDDPGQSVLLRGDGAVVGCSGKVWALGMFTAEQEYLGSIQVERPLSAQIRGGIPERLPPSGGGPPRVVTSGGGRGSAPAAVNAAAMCPSPLVLDTAALAMQNAPVLRFPEQERYYPTIPFHTAFDTRDSDGDGLIGFDDPDEVAPPGSPGSSGASWTRLRDEYDAALQDLDDGTEPGQWLYPPVPAVFYRVRMLGEGDMQRLWRFLRTDEQAWRRYGMDNFWENWSKGCQAMASVEYYFYYLDDWGLEGHEEDIEFEFVFVTLHPSSNEADLRVAVGAGHGSRTPNNTLVMVEADANRRNHVLVELGGHASAPDAPPRPEFAKFIDVNWHPTDLWGTRDVLALAGSGFIGRYSSDMTLPRERGLALQARTPGRDVGYSLLPVSHFLTLDSLVANQADDAQILRTLRDISADVPGMHVPDTLRPEVRASLEQWGRPLCCGAKGGELATEDRRIWEHSHFKRGSGAILMTHLYRPTNTALRSLSDYLELWTWSTTLVPDDMGGASVGFVIPVILQHKIPVRIRGFLTAEWGWVRALEEALPPDGSPTPQAPRRAKNGWTTRLTYDWSYSRLIGWYTAGQYTSKEWDRRDQLFDDSFALSAGASLLLMTAEDRNWWKPVRALRLRVGPRFRISEFDDLLQNVGLDIQLTLR